MIRQFIFIGIQMILSPIALTGRIWLIHKLGPFHRTNGLSITAFYVFCLRWKLHDLGQRKDKLTEQLLFSLLETISPFAFRLIQTPRIIAIKLSGCKHKKKAESSSHSSSKGARERFLKRTQFFDRALLENLSRVKQIVLLGAGWDTRAYSLVGKEGIAVFEVDQNEMQKMKQMLLQKAGVGATGVHFVALDFNSESWFSSLLKSGFKPELATFFLWEGVTYYLQERSISEIFEVIRTQISNESLIAFDYTSKELLENPPSFFSRQFLKFLNKIGEPWLFGISTTPSARGQISKFLEAHGLTLEDYQLDDEGARILGGFVLAAIRST